MSTSDSTLEIDAADIDDAPAPPRAKRRARPRREATSPPAPKPQSPTKATNSTTGKETGTTTAEVEPVRRPGALFAAVPSWLVSMILHMALLVILALLVVPERPKPVGVHIESVASVEDFPLVETVQIETVQLETTELLTTSVASADLTSTSLSDVGAISAAPANLSASDLELTATDQIGDLFVGDGGKRMGTAIDGAAKGSAQFFGVKSTGRRFVFIVDSSNSMRGGKFDAAKEELLYAIRRLSKDQAFYILFFDHDAARMTLPPNKEPELLCVPATNENINRAEAWVKTVVNELRTDPFDCVEFALDIVPDVIYLLSDGKFTDKGQTERFLKANNIIEDAIDGRRPKCVVNTICFWQRDGQETMQAIAKAYGGTYRFVPPGKN
ncbi:MAG: hypothetical protein SFU86_13850 [Pirellulaceae bacterium]|nr:hypothetical protein [Pirellulaceae bacterium]